jgi:hypothetical protein
VSVDVPTLEEILYGLMAEEDGHDRAEFTYEEIEKLTGLSRVKARALVKLAIKEGKLTAERKVRPCITRPGYNVSCTVFRVCHGT